MDRRRLPVQREVRRDRRTTTTLRIELVADDGTTTVLSESVPGPGRRGRRRHRHAGRRPARVPDRADRPRQGRGRAVLGPPQGDDDEGLRPDHLRPRGHARSSPRSSPTYGEQLAAAGLDARTTASAASWPASTPLADGAEIKAAIRGRDQAGSTRARAGDGRLRPGHHQPARAERRDRRRLDAGDDPHQRPHVGTRRPGGRHARGDPGLVVRRDLPGRHRRLPRPRRLRPDHDGLGPQRRPDGAGRRGVRLPRQDLRDPGRRHGAGRRREPAPSCSSTTSTPATSGVPARPRTSRSATGSSWPSTRARADRRTRGLLARREPRPRRQPDRQGPRPTCPSTTPSGLRDPDPDAELDAIAFSLERIRRARTRSR